jgi:Cdc6-like AAA superfamily ATPase
VVIDTNLVEIRRWLSAPDPSINYQKARKLRESDTGLWLLESEVYSKWKRNASSFAWLYGIPGCGKTILSSTVTQDIIYDCASDPGKVVAYFYFDFTDENKQKPDISQLSEQRIKMPLALEKLFSSFDKGNRQPSSDALMIVLQQMLQEFPQSYVVLDALDECTDRGELMRILEQMAGWQLETLRVLITSRKERDIESSLENIVNGEYIICLQSQVVDKDIQLYVRQRLSNDKGLGKWRKDADMKREIEMTMMKGSRGMLVSHLLSKYDT